MWALFSILVTTIFILYYFFMFKPNQNAKNKKKQEAKEKSEVDKLFIEIESSILHDSYESFKDTQLMERVN